MKQRFIKLVTTFLLLFLLLGITTSNIPEAKASGCGGDYQEIHRFCNGETLTIFCNSLQENWGIYEYDIQVGSTVYTITRWICGGNEFEPGINVYPWKWVNDFPIINLEEGEGFDAYCAAGEQYMVTFPLAYGEIQPPFSVPIDQYLCLDYFPYIP